MILGTQKKIGEKISKNDQDFEILRFSLSWPNNCHIIKISVITELSSII